MLTSPLQIIPLSLHPRCPSPPPHSPAPFSPLSISSGSLVPIYTHGGVSNQEHARTRQNMPEHARTRQNMPEHARTRQNTPEHSRVEPGTALAVRPPCLPLSNVPESVLWLWTGNNGNQSVRLRLLLDHLAAFTTLLVMRCYSKVYLFSVMQVCCILASDLVNISLTPSEQRGMTISVQA